MKKKKPSKAIIGIGWYKQEQWKLLRECSDDTENLENTFYEWVANASESIKTFIKAGHRVEKIEIDVHELIEWCKDENCPVNGESRSKFISLKTKEMFR